MYKYIVLAALLTGCATPVAQVPNLNPNNLASSYVENMSENDQVGLFLCSLNSSKEAMLLGEDESIIYKISCPI